MATVLIVDDEKCVRDVYSRLLTKTGHAVLTVDDGNQALDTLALTSIDVVILDYSMPELSGLDCLREMKLRGYSEIPVLFVKPFDKAGREIVEGLGIYCFIDKVSDMGNLDRLVRQAAKEY